MDSGKNKCTCGNYLSYGDYLADKKVISAPMMPLDECINCANNGKVRVINTNKHRSQ